MSTVEEVLWCREAVEREINRPLTTEEQNIVRIAFFFGRGSSYDNVFDNDGISSSKAKIAVSQLWQEYGNIIVDDHGNIEQGWRHFSVGTNISEIRHWIEKEYDVSITKDLFNSVTA